MKCCTGRFSHVKMFSPGGILSLSPKPSSECTNSRIATGNLYEKCLYLKTIIE